jgi:uncharacterized membrane protein
VLPASHGFIAAARTNSDRPDAGGCVAWRERESTMESLRCETSLVGSDGVNCKEYLLRRQPKARDDRATVLREVDKRGAALAVYPCLRGRLPRRQDRAVPQTPDTASDAAPGPLPPLPPPTPFDIGLRRVHLGDIPRWLWRGATDFTHAPLIGVFYGACFVAMGWALLGMFTHAPVYTLALAAGFLLMGPFACMGLYRVSQQLERGEAPHFLDSIGAWRTCTGTLAIFGFTLLVIEMLWGRVTLVIFALSFDGMPDFKGSLLKLLDPENLGFIAAYLCAGAFFAGLIFAISAVSIPMILDLPVDAITAGLTSLRLVLAQTGVMLVWALTIAVIIVVAMLPGFLGLLMAGPVIGHASWHAYRAAVEG